jgi:Icc-related predicted phosphoesterase
MRFGALGDIHGDFATVRRIMRQHPDIPFWVCVGDVADDDGRYEPLDAPLYWIKGNNENFDLIAAGDLPVGLHYLPNGTVQRIDGLAVAGLGGTFAPTMYDTRAAELPHPKKGSAKATELADRRRHFVREEVEACKAMREVDLLLTHEAPRPFRVGPAGRGNDAGKTPINEILAAMKPRLHLFGHHHRFVEMAVQGVRSVGLDLVSSSYLLVDAKTMEYHVSL